MLTRLQVTGFKNLSDIDVRLGPFTCIAGPNGVGKSNFFDAIAFLSALANQPLVDAALSVRGAGAGDVRNLFRRIGSRTTEEMSFLVEMVIPESGEDELGQSAKASMTYLQYELMLRYRGETAGRPLGSIELVSERMTHLNRSDAKAKLGFELSKAWLDSALRGRRTSPYISTEEKAGGKVVALHADAPGGTGGPPRRLLAATLPRTILSSVNNAAEHRTLVLARQEMRSWMQLQLEPSSLRAADPFSAPHAVGANGAHLPATLYYLAKVYDQREPGSAVDLYARIANRLAELIQNVDSVSVDRDEKRQVLNIVMTDLQRTPHLAGSLSDGTLRFLALAVMEADPGFRGLLCLEEPENGVHPSRVAAMLRLLQDLAVDPTEPVGRDNPLRQVIINTHSPVVVSEVPADALLVAQVEQDVAEGERSQRLSLSVLPRTWRTHHPPRMREVSRGTLLAYLNPVRSSQAGATSGRASSGAEEETDQIPGGPVRVKDRQDLQVCLPWGHGAAAQ